MVDVSWRQDVLKFLKFPKNANSDLQSCSCTLLFFVPAVGGRIIQTSGDIPNPIPPNCNVNCIFQSIATDTRNQSNPGGLT